MAPEADAWFLGNTVGIRIDGAKKLLDFLRDLLVARQDALTWLDVMLHFRLHSYPPRTLEINTYGMGKFRLGGV